MQATSLRRSDPRPFLPADARADRSLIRAVIARALSISAGVHNESAEGILAHTWPADRGAFAVLRAATSPADTSITALAATAVSDFVAGLQPMSAAARLIGAGVSVSLAGLSTISIPRATTRAQPAFVAEAAPIPIGQSALAAGVVGPARKMALAECYTGELREHSNIETVLGTLLREAAAASLDAAVFSTTAADSTRPAGILNGTAPLTATTGGGLGALVGDIRKLTAAISASGGGAGPIWFVGSPATAAAAQILGGAGFADRVILPGMGIADDALIAVDVLGFASGFGADPQIDISNEATIVLQDTNPPPISVSGTPNIVGAPTRSLWQSNSLAIRVILRVAWAMRAPGLAQFIQSGLTW